MNSTTDKEVRTDDGLILRPRSRPVTVVTLPIPDDTLASLERVAAGKEMAVDALLRLYIGQGLRHDLARLFTNNVLENVAQVLTHHIESEETIATILREGRELAVA